MRSDDRSGLVKVAVTAAIALLVVVGNPSRSRAQEAEGRTLVVATREVPPFAMRDEAGDWRGISIDLLNEVRREIETVTGDKIELDLREMGLDEMLDAVESGEVDLAAAALTVNFEREKRLDFSHGYFSSGLGIAVARGDRELGFFELVRSILSPTFLRIVSGLLATMLAVAVAVYFFERRGNREQFGGGMVRGIASGLWWSAVTLTTVGYGDKVPKTTGGRIVGLGWMFSGLFIIASFTAAVTSALTVTQLRSRISGPGDLSRVRVATVADSTSAAYLSSRRIYHRKHPDIDAALASLSDGGCDAVVYDAPVMRYAAKQRFDDRIMVLPAVFEQQDYAFAIPSGDPLRETINQALLRATSEPDWQSGLLDLLGEPGR